MTTDAALQLENFYSEIVSPASSDVNFTYTSDLYQVENVTRTRFSRFFKGSEIVVAGKVATKLQELNDPCKSHCVNGNFIVPVSLTLLSSSAACSNGMNSFAVVVNGKSAEGFIVLDSADIVLCDNRTKTSLTGLQS